MKTILLCLAFAATCWAAETNSIEKQVSDLQESLGHLDARLTRQMNELLWSQRLADVAVIDRLRFTGPPPRSTNRAPEIPGSNDVVVSAMTFLPRERSRWRKLPLIVLVHGEIHGNVASDEDAGVVRELVQQGYAVIAPDYRGSSGYGGGFWRRIDYGGLEIEDVHAARQCMLERDRMMDPRRVGIVGWSHGGMIALMAAARYPDSYAACYAGVPVSDLAERIRIRGKEYEKLFAAPYHIGKTVAEDPEEYRRRSPVAHAGALRTPLLIQANTNDEDVTIAEIQRLFAALDSSGRSYEHHVYTNAPGGHLFNRIDTPLARESRVEIWRFLAKHLHPSHPVK